MSTECIIALEALALVSHLMPCSFPAHLLLHPPLSSQTIHVLFSWHGDHCYQPIQVFVRSCTQRNTSSLSFAACKLDLGPQRAYQFDAIDGVTSRTRPISLTLPSESACVQYTLISITSAASSVHGFRRSLLFHSSFHSLEDVSRKFSFVVNKKKRSTNKKGGEKKGSDSEIERISCVRQEEGKQRGKKVGRDKQSHDDKVF